MQGLHPKHFLFWHQQPCSPTPLSMDFKCKKTQCYLNILHEQQLDHEKASIQDASGQPQVNQLDSLKPDFFCFVFTLSLHGFSTTHCNSKMQKYLTAVLIKTMLDLYHCHVTIMFAGSPWGVIIIRWVITLIIEGIDYQHCHQYITVTHEITKLAFRNNTVAKCGNFL